MVNLPLLGKLLVLPFFVLYFLTFVFICLWHDQHGDNASDVA
jgi:hypothetical protein